MTIGVFGTGRFGSFWATQLSRHATVYTYSRNSERPTPAGCTGTTLAQIAACDAVMLCVAIHAVPDALRSLVPHLRPETTLLDTCSVKVFPVREMLAEAPRTTQVIGSHPMFGPDSARRGVEGLPIVLSPGRSDEAALGRWRAFFEEMGLRVLIRTPEEHDREAAMTQGVTHFLGRVLAELDLSPSEMGTVGYQKLLEVVEQTCNDPYQLFLDLQQYNPFTSQMRSRLRNSISEVSSTLERELDSGT
jgi:prephenate dehydrogenase